MFHRFNGPARRAFRIGIREARRCQHDFMGTEHLLFGLLYDSTNDAVRLLQALGVDTQLLFDQIETLFKVHPHASPAETLPISPALRRVVEKAETESTITHHALLGPAHLMLALLAESGSQALMALQAVGVSATAFRDRLRTTVPSESLDYQVQPPPSRAYLNALEPSAEEIASSVQWKPTPAEISPKSQTLLNATSSTTSANVSPEQSASVLAQLRKTQMVFGGILGFLIGSLGHTWELGVLVAMAGVTIGLLHNSYAGALLGAVGGFTIDSTFFGQLEDEPLGGRILAALIGAFLGSFLGDFWRNPPAWLEPKPWSSPADRET